MKNLFIAYRVLALVVGVLLAFCSLVALPLKYLATEGSDLQEFGEAASIMWVAHGWVFMVYVVVAFLPRPQGELDARRSRSWPWSAGLIPLLIFWVEHRVTQRFAAEHPELRLDVG